LGVPIRAGFHQLLLYERTTGLPVVGTRKLSEHLTQLQASDYSQRKLSSAELLSLSDHLAECDACRRRIEIAMKADSSFLALRSGALGEGEDPYSSGLAPAHLTAEEIAGYVDGNLPRDELQTVTDHLSHCDQCDLEVEDLRAFKAHVIDSLEHECRPVPVPSRTEPRRRNTARWFLPAFLGRSPRLAMAAATCAVVAVTGWWIWRAIHRIERVQQIEAIPNPAVPDPTRQPDQAPVPIIAQLNDGQGVLALDREGTLRGADDVPPAYQKMLKETLMSGTIRISPMLKGLTGRSSSLMSTEKQTGEFTVIEPIGKVLLTDRPVFRWSMMAGATLYVVEVYDNKFNLVAASPQLTATSWTAPESLPRGGVYTWQIKAIKDGQEIKSPRPPAPQARFRILDQSRANEVAKARRAYPSSHLALGLLYAEAGLLSEAEQELRVVQKANPESEIARELLSQVQAAKKH